MFEKGVRKLSGHKVSELPFTGSENVQLLVKIAYVSVMCVTKKLAYYSIAHFDSCMFKYDDIMFLVGKFDAEGYRGLNYQNWSIQKVGASKYKEL